MQDGCHGDRAHARRKKRAANKIISEAGKTASGFIGDLYDYIIDEGKLPDLSRSKKSASNTRTKAELYTEFIAESAFDIPESYWLDDEGAVVSDDDLLVRALEDKYGFAS